MNFDLSEWVKLVHNNTPVYIRPFPTDWFVPTEKAEKLLSDTTLLENRYNDNELRFFERLPDNSDLSYPGRADLLPSPDLKELWFHLTDRCNMSCSHCLFSSTPSSAAELETDKVLALIEEAEKSGCKVFALTGGEPFVHPGIATIISRIMEIEDSHAVILTNGLEAANILNNFDFDPERLHLQISVDGIGNHHDSLRGSGMFEKLKANLADLSRLSIPYTLSMCVTASNAADMPELINFAYENGASNVHFMWYFMRGRGAEKEFIPPAQISTFLLEAWKIADEKNISIDNIETVRSMIFTPCGTVHDGSTAGWESAAIGPDGKIYPSAATVSIPELATPIESGLISSIRKSSVLEQIRKTSAVNQADPFRLILGGGDMDHSYMHKGTFSGNDPYFEISRVIALELIHRKALSSADNSKQGLSLKMGDVLSRCSDHGAVALTHNNCLLAVAGPDSLSVVKDFYTRAAETANDDILNPVCYSEDLISHIPEELRFRGYGCGSPVMDADITKGEHIVDLGSGRGIECFIASRLTGSKGKVTGIDMLDPMLKIAEKGRKAVSEKLGYSNIEFLKGYLEHMPLENDCVDLILSNCVLNLSTDKRSTFKEIFRVLNPGGRITVSDVVCENEPGPEIRNNDKLHGECIAGALTIKNLNGLLYESGFENFKIIKRFPYREVGGHQFYSLTFSAFKPEKSANVKVLYRGPLPSIRTAEGKILFAGKTTLLPESEAARLGDQIFVIDEHDNVANLDIGASCCCSTATDFDNPVPTAKTESSGCCTPASSVDLKPLNKGSRNLSGCLFCGAEIEYTPSPLQMTCVYCGKELDTNTHCINDHFVCDSCHSKDSLSIIRSILLCRTETDMVELLKKIRQHPVIPIHGPEHHSIVPGIITTAYRNSGGNISDETILTAISRGAKVAGGYCGFMGICGAAMGVGVAISTILEATPYTAEARSASQQGTLAALTAIADVKAARCCQRDSWLALKAAGDVSEKLLGLKLNSEVDINCSQMKLNKECMGPQCPVIQNSNL